MKLAVISQSLTSRVYRSFYIHLQKQNPLNCLDLVTSKQGFELGGQRIQCDPFELPADCDSILRDRIQFLSLSTFFPHIQAWLPFGLNQIFRKKELDFVICLCEPYSVSFLWIYIQFKLSHRGKTKFIAFSAQNIIKKFNPILNLIQQFCFKQVFAMLFVGNEQRLVAQSQGWTGKSVYFPLWFDESVFFLNQDIHCKSKKTFCIGYAGSYTEQKGILDLIAALSKVTEESGNLDVYFCGSGFLDTQINQFKKINDGKKNIRIENLGAIGPDLMPQFYNRLDLLIVPSKTTPHWKEQFGRVIIEAMACGAEVIGSSSGEIPIVVGQSQNIYSEGNTDQLTELILGQIDTWQSQSNFERTKARVGRSGDAFARFSSSHLAKRFYNELLNLRAKEA